MKIQIKYSKRKSISVKIIDENNILVSAPKGVSKTYIDNFLNSKQNWINNKINSIKNKNIEFNDVINKTKYMIFGEVISYNGNFKNYYESLCKNYVINRVEEISKLCGLTYNNLYFKNFTSKWGHCDNNKNITINYKLVFLKKQVIDYVIVHELCHTQYMNHQKEFRALLSSYFKNEALYKKELKKYGFLAKLKY